MPDNLAIPPHCPEAERGVLGCCLLDIKKVGVALKAGVTPRWFYDIRHSELFSALSTMAMNGGGDFIVATLILRERGKLESIGGTDYLIQLQDGVPSAENLEYYIPELRDYFQRRQILAVTARLQGLARDPATNPASLVSDTETVLEWLHRENDSNALPEIVPADQFLAVDIPKISARIKDEGYSLVIVDPTYKLLGQADENNARDITALLNSLEKITVTTGAAVAMASHFAKGNAAAKESIDRISGSGVFARDPDSLITFTKHEEEGAFTVEMVLRNLPPVEPFVVRWQHPIFRRANELDPTKLKQAGGRPAQHTKEELLECLGDKRLTSDEWKAACEKEYGMGRTCFYKLRKVLEAAGKALKSAVDDRWQKMEPKSANYEPYKDQ